MNYFIDITYSRGLTKITLPAQYQYNTGQQLRIYGVESGVTVSVHYAVRGMLKPIARTAVLKDKAWISAIPNVLMAQKLPIQAFVYMVDATSAQTVCEMELPIIERPMPDGYDIDDEDIVDINRILYDLQQALAAAESITNMTASAQTLQPGQPATSTLVDNNGVKQLQFGIPQGATGKQGGYYIPVISEDGMLTWTTSDSAMSDVDFKFNVIGPEGKQGNPGVYIGKEEPDDPNITVWIDEDGQPDLPSSGSNGATFTPSVSSDGTLSWTNDGGLENPKSVNIKGPKGDNGVTPQLSIGAVSTGNTAQASITGPTNDLKLNLTIPQGSGGGSGDGTVISINNVEPDAAGNVALHLDHILPDSNEQEVADGYIQIPIKSEDSDKLGGKAPEYYTNPRNLLDNSDFEVGCSGKHGFARWDGTDSCTFVVNDGVKTFTSTSGYTYIYQIVFADGRDVGKPYTLAITLEDGTRLAASGNAPSPHESSQLVFCDIILENNCEVFLIKEPSGELRVRLNTKSTGASLSFRELDLFEGIYTADNVPPHVPKCYANELLACQVAEHGVLIAHDSAKLGGKAPEYYIQHRNLLDNSDWRIKANIVNRKNVTIVEPYKDCIDRWGVEGSGTLEVLDDSLQLTVEEGADYVGFNQNLENYSLMKGKTYTLAFNADDVVRVVAFVMGGSGAGHTNGNFKIYSVDGLNMLIRFHGQSTKLYWAALYEGHLTADNLPPYVPKGYAAELLACNIAETGVVHDSAKLGGKAPEYYLQPVNLLDNSDFYNPVNQRGQTSYDQTSVSGYTIDRWRAQYGILTVNNGYVTWKATAIAQYKRLIQWIGTPIEAGKTYTIAMLAKVKTNPVLATLRPIDNTSVMSGASSFTISGTTADYQWFVHSFTPTATPTKPGMEIFVSNTTDRTFEADIKCMAFYEGAYTAETLPPYVPKGYVAELAECQRYYVRIGSEAGVMGYTGGSGTIYVLVPLPQVMRLQNVSLDTGSTVVIVSGGNAKSIDTFTSSKNIANQLELQCAADSNVGIRQQLTGWTSRLGISADL